MQSFLYLVALTNSGKYLVALTNTGKFQTGIVRLRFKPFWKSSALYWLPIKLKIKMFLCPDHRDGWNLDVPGFSPN